MSFISLVTHIYKTHVVYFKMNTCHFTCGILCGLLSNLSRKKIIIPGLSGGWSLGSCYPAKEFIA